MRIIKDVQPDDIYNLAAQSQVAVSFECYEYTATSELYGEEQEIPQKETTLFHPRSPYAFA